MRFSHWKSHEEGDMFTLRSPSCSPLDLRYLFRTMLRIYFYATDGWAALQGCGSGKMDGDDSLSSLPGIARGGFRVAGVIFYSKYSLKTYLPDYFEGIASCAAASTVQAVEQRIGFCYWCRWVEVSKCRRKAKRPLLWCHGMKTLLHW